MREENSTEAPSLPHGRRWKESPLWSMARSSLNPLTPTLNPTTPNPITPNPITPNPITPNPITPKPYNPKPYNPKSYRPSVKAYQVAETLASPARWLDLSSARLPCTWMRLTGRRLRGQRSIPALNPTPYTLEALNPKP